MKKIISLTVAILFLVNNISYALNVQPGSLNPAVRNDMYDGAQQLWRAKVGPGGTWLDRVLSKLQSRKFIGEKPEIENMTFNSSPEYYPVSWKKNPILRKTDLIEALEYFRDNEAQIPAELLEIKEVYYELEKGREGELPLMRIEEYQYGLETRHRLAVHTKLVQMWNHIRKNDVWFDYKFENGETRTISIAWGIFYQMAKHEMADLGKNGMFSYSPYRMTEKGEVEKVYNEPKGGGHLGWYVEKGKKKIKEERDEVIANQIGGRYNMINSDILFWFLQSYCFYDSTRYNNRTFRKRMQWVFSRAGSEEGASFLKEFSKLSQTWFSSFKENQENLLLTQAINYHFFSRKGIKVPKLTVDPKLIKEFKDREYLIVGKPMYAGGKNESNDPINGQKWNYAFKGAALIAAGKISWNIQKKVDKLNQLIGRKAVTELTVDEVKAIKKELDTHWVTDAEFDEMAELEGEKGKAFCKQVPREARLPFEMIVAMWEDARDESSSVALGEWLDKIFKRVETGELNLDVVEKTIVEMSTRLSSESVPTINGFSLESSIEIALVKRQGQRKVEIPAQGRDGKLKGNFVKKIYKKVKSNIESKKKFLKFKTKEHKRYGKERQEFDNKVDDFMKKAIEKEQVVNSSPDSKKIPIIAKSEKAFFEKLGNLNLPEDKAPEDYAVIDLLETFAACCADDVSKELNEFLEEIRERLSEETGMRKNAIYKIFRGITKTYIFLAIEKMLTGYTGVRTASHTKIRFLIASYVFGGTDNIPEELFNMDIPPLEYVKKLRVYIGGNKGLIPQQALNSTPISGIFESLKFKDKGENKEAYIGQFADKEKTWEKIVELYYCGVVKNIVLVSAENYKNKPLENQYHFGPNDAICSGSVVALGQSLWADIPVFIEAPHSVVAKLGRDGPRNLFVDQIEGQLVAKIVPVEGKEEYWKTVEGGIKNAINAFIGDVNISIDTANGLKPLNDKKNYVVNLDLINSLNEEEVRSLKGDIPAKAINEKTGKEYKFECGVKETDAEFFVEVEATDFSGIEALGGNIRVILPDSVLPKDKVTVPRDYAQNGPGRIISDYTAPLYKDEGPGVIKPLDAEKRYRVWQGVNASREENLEIFIPQSVQLTDDMQKKLIEVKASMRKIGKVLLWERYSAEGDSVDEFFETLGRNKENTKRIVLTDDETVPLLLCQIETKEEIANLFRDIKMINVCLPGSLDEDGRTKWQMHLFMTAFLARLLEPGDKYFNDIRILLEDMLEGCFTPDVDVKDFVGMLSSKEDEHTPIQKIRERIKYFLLDTPSISLIEKLRVEWEAIKEYYKHL